MILLGTLPGRCTGTCRARRGMFALSLMGGCVGYLRYNRYPAKVFMGDTGSMFLGGATIGLAMVLRQPLLLILIGICPILSSVSVILQRYYFKLTRRFSKDHQGRRLFRMSPIHHHFEKKGYTRNSDRQHVRGDHRLSAQSCSRC